MDSLGLTVRPYRPEDREAYLALAAAHQARDGPCFVPDPQFPYHVLTMVVERNGRLVAAGTGRLTAELYLLQDPTAGSPAERWQNITALLDRCGPLGKAVGVDEAHIFVPRTLERYAERLQTIPGVMLDDRLHLMLFLSEQG